MDGREAPSWDQAGELRLPVMAMGGGWLAGYPVLVSGATQHPSGVARHHYMYSCTSDKLQHNRSKSGCSQPCGTSANVDSLVHPKHKWMITRASNSGSRSCALRCLRRCSESDTLILSSLCKARHRISRPNQSPKWF